MKLEDFYQQAQVFLKKNNKNPNECYALINWKTLSILCRESAGVYCSGNLMYGYKNPIKKTNLTTSEIFDIPTFFHKHVPKDVVYFFIGEYDSIRTRCMDMEEPWEEDRT